MKLKSNIHTRFTKKALGIPLILIFSICLFVINAFAGGCYGGEGCFSCGEMDHRHTTGAKMGFMPHSCQPEIQNSTCGILVNRRISEHQNVFVSAIRVDNHLYFSITTGPAIDYSRNPLSEDSISTVHFSARIHTPPLYLLNLSFLC
jgi:hypothetical protein